MATISAKSLNSVGFSDPRKAFESALETMKMGTPKKPSSMPIYNRRKLDDITSETIEKQALSDAAKALAQLWRLSASPAR